MAAADISDFGAIPKFGDDTIKRRQPVLDKVIEIPWPEEPRRRTEQARSVIAPINTAPVPECLLHPWLDILPRHDAIECTHHRHRTILDGEQHGLLRWQREFPRRRVIDKIA